jgi:hypothetical protein
MAPCVARRVHASPRRGGSLTQLLPNFWGSFSSSSLVTWAAQVAGGDEPPSVLSDNLSKVWLIARPFAISAAARSLTSTSHAVHGVHALYSVSKLGSAPRGVTKYHK